jgi:hypothetical protein
MLPPGRKQRAAAQLVRCARGCSLGACNAHDGCAVAQHCSLTLRTAGKHASPTGTAAVCGTATQLMRGDAWRKGSVCCRCTPCPWIFLL